MGFERTRVSLRRDDLASARCLGHVWCFTCILAQARLEWVFGREMISPKRDNFMLLLF